MDRVALDLGFIQIYWYSICLFVGMLAASFVIYREAKRRGIEDETLSNDILFLYEQATKNGKITLKETKLWKFVLSYYGLGEFSTKQLEKDFGDAAYATIRGFVLKFEDLGLLSSVKYGPRVKYKVIK